MQTEQSWPIHKGAERSSAARQKWLMSLYSCNPINHVHDHVAEKHLIQKYHSLKVKTVNEKINQFVFIIADFYIGGVLFLYYIMTIFLPLTV